MATEDNPQPEEKTYTHADLMVIDLRGQLAQAGVQLADARATSVMLRAKLAEAIAALEELNPKPNRATRRKPAPKKKVPATKRTS